MPELPFEMDDLKKRLEEALRSATPLSDVLLSGIPLRFLPMPDLRISVEGMDRYRQELAKLWNHGPTIGLIGPPPTPPDISDHIDAMRFSFLENDFKRDKTLKIKFMRKGKIIGYKFKEKCKQYEDAALSIGEISTFLPTIENVHIHANSVVDQKLNAAGVRDLWFDAVHEELRDPVVGEWWTRTWAYDDKDVDIFKIKEYDPEDKEAIIFRNCHIRFVEGDRDNIWADEAPIIDMEESEDDSFRPSTEEEIGDALKALMKKQGIVPGVKLRFKNLTPFVLQEFERIDVEYDANEDSLLIRSRLIYSKGEWAKIIGLAITINGEEMKIGSNIVNGKRDIAFGCQRMTDDFVIRVAELQEKYGVDFTAEKDKIQKIADFLKNLREEKE